MIHPTEVLPCRKLKRKRPAAESTIPEDATILGSILSEILPARGEKSAIIMGWEMSTAPAVPGSKPLMYWR